MTWPLSGQSIIMNSRRNETLRVKRVGGDVPGNVRYVDGKPVQVTSKEFTTVANVQPLSGRELLLVPEGDRYRENNWAFQQKPCEPFALNDLVQRDLNGQCVNYQCQSVDDWGSYVRARIVRMDVGPAKTP